MEDKMSHKEAKEIIKSFIGMTNSKEYKEFGWHGYYNDEFRVLGKAMEVVLCNLDAIEEQNNIPKSKIEEKIEELHIADIEPWSIYKISGKWLFELKELLEEE